MTPLQRYTKAIANGEYQPDPAQKQAIDALQAIYAACLDSKWLWNKRKVIHGLYLWGSVGRGKTWLMDIFYQSLTQPKKARWHYHQFIQEVHSYLRLHQGLRDPLKKLAQFFASFATVICLDEFFVNDIADAMLLSGLLVALFKQGITLIITSNIPPEQLYQGGLQRTHFLPAIALLKQHTKVIHLAGDLDYRLRLLEQAQLYYYPLNPDTTSQMQQRFAQLTNSVACYGQALLIEQRAIQTIAYSADVVWFDFSQLCHSPRSQKDYLAITRQYHTLMLSNVPQILPEQDNLVTYLINLIDILYDAQVKLIVSANVPITEIYPAGRLIYSFRRTISRLQEMQSCAYLQYPHRVA